MSGGSFDLAREESPCPVCGGPSFTVVFSEAARVPVLCGTCQEAADAAEADADRRRRVDAALERAGGQRMLPWTLETYPRDRAGIAAVNETRPWIDGWVAGERRNLMLFGTVGAGKTGLAWAILRLLIEGHGADGMVVNFRDLLVDLKQSFDARNAGLPSDYLRAPHVEVLVLDDLGSERPTDFALEELASLVERRYMRQLVTIITSNYDPAELAARLGHAELVIGKRIVSRLQEGATQVRFAGRDRRV